jgi:sortase A
MISKYIIVFFVFSLIVFNWSDLAWVFNPESLSYGIQNIAERRGEVTEEDDSISIPKINVNAPLVLPIDDDFDEALNRGVTLFTGSVFPGEDGLTILLGHSAPDNWPDVRYDSVFSDINDLMVGDEVYVVFNNRRYVYEIIDTIFVEQGEDIPTDFTKFNNMLALVSCWPPGRNQQRIVVRGGLTN